MKCDCHIHMVLDGEDWKTAIGRHKIVPNEVFIRKTLEDYQRKGYTYLRDGGDRWGVGKRAKEIAGEYGIAYRTPLAPLCKKGHYGAFIGETYENLRKYANFVEKIRKNGGDFVKIMISGLMEFDHFGVLSEEGLPETEIRQLVHIAHEEGLPVVAHANGASTVEAAAAAGVDSVEHGAYLDEDALCAMKEMGTVWVPTLSAIGNLLGKGRFDNSAVARILESSMENLHRFEAMGGFIGCGSDAGAWAVPHGAQTEEIWLAKAVGEETVRRGNERIREKF